MKDPEMLGNLVIGLGILIALITALNNYVSKPVSELNRTIAALDAMNEDVRNVEAAVKEQEIHDRESHSRMWVTHNDHNRRLNDHEKRISSLENRKEK